jgi:hypothetical protein
VTLATSLILAAVFFAADPHCPAYPESKRVDFRLAETKLRAFRDYSELHRRQKPAVHAMASSGNLIDPYLLGKMQADGLSAAFIWT